MTDQELLEVGIKIDQFNELFSILEKEIEMDKEDIQEVLQNLKQNGINSRQSLSQLTLGEAISFGIPKYSFVEFINNNNNKLVKQNIQKLLREDQKLGKKEWNGKSIQFYKYPIYRLQDFKDQSELKTLVFIGETGVGKSTIINFFSNFYIGVQYEDPFRFLIVNETGSEFSKNQAVSQTSEVTEYYLKGIDGKSHLKILDTPGFGDTKGYEQDEKISTIITNKLQNLDSINLICFVMKATTNRLTIPQKYIINRILQLFGKDVIQNFMFLFTFSDGEEPQALNALRFNGDSSHSKSPVVDLLSKVREPFWQQFNNGAFSSIGKKQMKDFWDESYEQFKKFYEEKILRTEFVTLKLTKEVISERKQIQNIIINVRPELQKQLNLMEEIQQQKNIIANLTIDQENSKNFKFKQTCYQIIKINLKLNEYVTNCIICNQTCHFPCAYSDSSDKINCCAMANGNCTVCPKNCWWENHKNMNFRFDTQEVIKEVELEDLKKRHQNSQKEKLSKEDLLKSLDINLQNVKKLCQNQIQKLMKSINRLNEIALLPAISDAESDYIEYLIKEEQDMKRSGYDKRIQSLKAIQKDFLWLKQEIQQQK